MRTNKIFAAVISAALSLCIAAAARADIFFAASNYANGSVGLISKTPSGGYSVAKDLYVGLAGDARGFSFRDHKGSEIAMICERRGGKYDTIFLWERPKWADPFFNRAAWGYNVHAAASRGDYLYLATYERYQGGSEYGGELIRVDMKKSWTTADKRITHTGVNDSADTGGQYAYPHGEDVYIDDDGYVYALVNYSTESAFRYAATKIIKYDKDLKKISEVELREGDAFGRNAKNMAFYGGKLYVACIGGYQGPDSWGDIWEADFAGNKARRLLDGNSIQNGGNAVGMYGVRITPEGRAFILTGSYTAGYASFVSRIFRIEAGALSGANPGQSLVQVAEYKNAGYSWDILYDDAASTLWVMTGKNIEARDKDGKLLKTFEPLNIGDSAYTISLLEGALVKYAEARAVKPGLPGTPENTNVVKPVFIDENNAKAFTDATKIPVSVVNVNGSKQVVTDEKYAREAVASVYGGSAEATEIVLLQPFSAGTDGKKFVTTGYELDGASLLADYAKDVRVLKILPDKKAKAYTYDASGSEEDGTFRILKDGSDYKDALKPNGKYQLALTIADDGPYDLDKTTGNLVLDPPVILKVTAVTGGGGNGGGSEGGGGGGCDAGFGAAALLLAVLALPRRGKRRH